MLHCTPIMFALANSPRAVRGMRNVVRRVNEVSEHWTGLMHVID